MRVVYFSQDYGPHDYRFLRALAATEHQVHFMRLEDTGRNLETRPIPEGISVLEWWGGRRPLRAVDYPRAVWHATEELGRLEPDLVHAGPIQGPAFVTSLAGFRPLVSMSWGSDLLWKARRGVARWAARYALARSQVLVCDCDAVRRQAIRLGMLEDWIVVFPWGVDLDHFSPAGSQQLRTELGWEDCFLLLSTRSWEPLFGVDLLIEGFIRAAQENPQLRLLLLGGGSLASNIRDAIDEAGMNERVHIAGHVEFDKLVDHYRAADLYVSASHSDGSSISLLEAMACGLPALVSDIPGNREWVEPEENGWWFRAGDASDLQQRISEAVSGHTALHPMGARARQIAQERADWSRNFPKLLEAYVLALESGRSR